MMKQEFYLADEAMEQPQQMFYVLDQQSRKFDAMTIQLSKIVDMRKPLKNSPAEVTFPTRYIYEEIDDMDMVTYCRFIGLDHLKSAYPWFLSR